LNCPSISVKSIAAYYTAQITASYPEEEARQIVWILLEHFFGINRLMLAVNQDLRLSESEMLIFHDACKKILQHVPVQYVIGKSEFCGLSFELNSATLIPRPETEQLVQLILEKLPHAPLRILDIGTGSGCIAITLKKYRPDCEVFAYDISQEALQAAQKNAETHNTPVHFFYYDILSSDEPLNINKIDVIVSNPPYVCLSEKKAMRPNVLLHEPETALFVKDEEPLLFYKVIAKLAVNQLVCGGKIFFEINERFGNEVSEILQTYGFTNITIEKDFRENVRFVYAENS
jgi:release factor glutamine methyltransferase